MNFSVIIPIFNAGSTIEDAINSAFNIENCAEVICVDDYSNDDSVDRIIRLQRKYSNLRLISLQKNHGVGAARNRGIDAAKNKWITFLDADDTFCIDKNFKEDFANMVGSKVDILLFNHKIKDKAKQSFAYEINNGNLTRPDLVKLAERYLRNPVGHSIIPHCWGKIFRTTLLRSNGIRFREDLKIYEDLEFVSSCFLYASGAFFSNSNLVYYSGSQGLSKSFEEQPLAFTSSLEKFGLISSNRKLVPKANAVFLARTLVLSSNLPLSRRIAIFKNISKNIINIETDGMAIYNTKIRYIVRFRLFRFPHLCSKLI